MRISDWSSDVCSSDLFFLALAVLAEAVIVRAVGVQDAGHRQVEGLVHVRQAGQARRGQRRTVIALGPRDDLLLLRPPERVVVVPDQLQDRVVRLRPRIGEERSEEHTSELQSLMRISYAVFCLKTKKRKIKKTKD